MPLYRAVYPREGRIKGMTFWASCPPMAADYAYNTLQGYIKAAGGGDILTVSPCPRHRLIDRMPRTRYTPA